MLYLIQIIQIRRCYMQSKQSVYLRIVDDFKRKIELGLLEKEERLPSCRELAFTLGVNPNTVQRAYSELENDGYIYTLPKKGVYVATRDNADKKKALETAARLKLAELKAAGMAKDNVSRLVDEVWDNKEVKS